MADQITHTAPEPAQSKNGDDASAVEPLTRRRYKRLPVTERQIVSALSLDEPAFVARARIRDEDSTEYLSAETLVYFIRRADRRDDRKCREALFRELLERCTPFFRGKFRGFPEDAREDLQGEVLKGVVEDLLAADNRGDFMQVRFWTYLERKAIDACRAASRYQRATESLNASLSDDGSSDGRTKLEAVTDERLGPGQLAVLAKALEALPPELRALLLLRHAVGMKIGEDASTSDNAEELTLAQHFNCTGRTIRNRLKEADRLLAGFREKKE